MFLLKRPSSRACSSVNAVPELAMTLCKPGGIHGDAVHLALDQDGVVELADRLLRLVEIEQHARLGIDRRLRRVEILRARISRQWRAFAR